MAFIVKITSKFIKKDCLQWLDALVNSARRSCSETNIFFSFNNIDRLFVNSLQKIIITNQKS